MFFKVGDIIRYDEGSTALMKITDISRKHNGIEDRYYGPQCMGGSCGAYASDTTYASSADLTTWEECKKWRRD